MIPSFCFGKGFGAMESEGFACPLLMTIQASTPLLFLIKSFPWIPRVLSFSPYFVSSCFPWHIDLQPTVRQQIKDLVDFATETPAVADEGRMPCVYHHPLSMHQSSVFLDVGQSLLEEALSLLQAGSDTVGNTCTVGAFHVLHNPTTHRKPVQELLAVTLDRGQAT